MAEKRLAQREALGLLLKADEAFRRCNPTYLEMVDNYAYLCLGEWGSMRLSRDEFSPVWAWGGGGTVGHNLVMMCLISIRLFWFCQSHILCYFLMNVLGMISRTITLEAVACIGVAQAWTASYCYSIRYLQ